jgi:hypothetical protein
MEAISMTSLNLLMRGEAVVRVRRGLVLRRRRLMGLTIS